MPRSVMFRSLGLATLFGGSQGRTGNHGPGIAELARRFRRQAPRTKPKIVSSRRSGLVLKRTHFLQALVLPRLQRAYPGRPLLEAGKTIADKQPPPAVEPELPASSPRDRLNALLATSGERIAALEAMRSECDATHGARIRASRQADLVLHELELASELEAAMPEASRIEGGRRVLHRQLIALAFGNRFAAPRQLRPRLVDLLKQIDTLATCVADRDLALSLRQAHLALSAGTRDPDFHELRKSLTRWGEEIARHDKDGWATHLLLALDDLAADAALEHEIARALDHLAAAEDKLVAATTETGGDATLSAWTAIWAFSIAFPHMQEWTASPVAAKRHQAAESLAALCLLLDQGECPAPLFGYDDAFDRAMAELNAISAERRAEERGWPRQSGRDIANDRHALRMANRRLEALLDRRRHRLLGPARTLSPGAAEALRKDDQFDKALGIRAGEIDILLAEIARLEFAVLRREQSVLGLHRGLDLDRLAQSDRSQGEFARLGLANSGEVRRLTKSLEKAGTLVLANEAARHSIEDVVASTDGAARYLAGIIEMLAGIPDLRPDDPRVEEAFRRECGAMHRSLLTGRSVEHLREQGQHYLGLEAAVVAELERRTVLGDSKRDIKAVDRRIALLCGAMDEVLTARRGSPQITAAKQIIRAAILLSRPPGDLAAYDPSARRREIEARLTAWGMDVGCFLPELDEALFGRMKDKDIALWRTEAQAMAADRPPTTGSPEPPAAAPKRDSLIEQIERMEHGQKFSVKAGERLTLGTGSLPIDPFGVVTGRGRLAGARAGAIEIEATGGQYLLTVHNGGDARLGFGVKVGLDLKMAKLKLAGAGIDIRKGGAIGAALTFPMTEQGRADLVALIKKLQAGDKVEASDWVVGASQAMRFRESTGGAQLRADVGPSIAIGPPGSGERGALRIGLRGEAQAAVADKSQHWANLNVRVAKTEREVVVEGGGVAELITPLGGEGAAAGIAAGHSFVMKQRIERNWQGYLTKCEMTRQTTDATFNADCLISSQLKRRIETDPAFATRFSELRDRFNWRQDVLAVTYSLRSPVLNEANRLLARAAAAERQRDQLLAEALRNKADSLVSDDNNYSPLKISVIPTRFTRLDYVNLDVGVFQWTTYADSKFECVVLTVPVG